MNILQQKNTRITSYIRIIKRHNFIDSLNVKYLKTGTITFKSEEKVIV